MTILEAKSEHAEEWGQWRIEVNVKVTFMCTSDIAHSKIIPLEKALVVL